MSVGRSLIDDAFLSLITGENQFGSWYTYATAFVLGGVVRYGKKTTGIIHKISYSIPFDWAISPAIEEIVSCIYERRSFRTEVVLTEIIVNGMCNFVKMKFIKEVLK